MGARKLLNSSSVNSLEICRVLEVREEFAEEAREV